MVHEIALILAATLSPISELRGGLPLALSLGIGPVQAYFLTVGANILLFFPVFFVLRWFYDSLLCRIPLFPRYLQRLRTRTQPKVTKYGRLGFTLLVAIPLPVTGVYTATILSWMLGMDWKKSFPAIALGVPIAGIIVLAVTMGVIHGWNIFVAR